jgi:DMSO/TMAO reductase YedYZ molybdopterin-dependent catalytic subunit
VGDGTTLAPGEGGGSPGLDSSVSLDRAAGLQSRWRSPIRGPWLTSVFGMILLVGIPVEIVTGLLSYAAYNPKLAGNDPNDQHGIFGLYLFNWFTEPAWIYRLIEGVHVMLGLALVPVVLAKLWSVMPRLFAWPPFRSLAQFLERATLIFLVGGVIFEMGTGILDINYFAPIGFNFYTGHFYGAWIFTAAFVVHVALRLGRAVTSLRTRRLRDELRTDLAHTHPEPPDGLSVAAHPAPPTISRRGVLAMVAGGSVAVFVLTAGETIGGSFRRLALLGTRDASPGVGANHFPVNHTAASVGIQPEQTGANWRLELVGTRTVRLSRDELLAMPKIDATLPIACTEGWSTVQRWTGVRLADLAALAGVAHPRSATLDTLDESSVMLSGSQVMAGQSMLALMVNGADLSLDHGYPARIMVPSAPGTHNKKWMTRISFEAV